jgi:hypothetical protein
MARPPRPTPRYRPPPHRGKFTSVHDDIPRGMPPMRAEAQSAHEIELEAENAELRAEITQGNLLGPPTSTPPATRYLQKKLWLLLAWALGIAGGTTITIVVGVLVKACLASHH